MTEEEERRLRQISYAHGKANKPKRRLKPSDAVSCINCQGSGRQPLDMLEFGNSLCFACNGHGWLTAAQKEELIRLAEH
jgi:DnaJ-class molecular chaperone